LKLWAVVGTVAVTGGGDVEIYEVLRQAVRERRQVAATYKGHRRLMCPHVLGTKGGRPQCLFYQFGGGSNSGPVGPRSGAGWRCIPVAELTDLEVLEDLEWFGVATSGRQTCIDAVDVEAWSRAGG
jgi:hypothetical protein